MVNVFKSSLIDRFPWSYSKVLDKDGNLTGFRIRLEFLIVTNLDDPFKFDLYHFTSLTDRMDNAQLAIDCGLEVSFGSEYLYVTPRRFSHIFQQIQDHEKLCASTQ